MRKAVRVIAAVTLLAVAFSGTTTSAAQRANGRASRGDLRVFARFTVWINSRLSPPTGIAQPESPLAPPTGVTPVLPAAP